MKIPSMYFFFNKSTPTFHNGLLKYKNIMEWLIDWNGRKKKRFIMNPFQIIYIDSIYGVTSNNKFLCEILPSRILIKF